MGVLSHSSATNTVSRHASASKATHLRRWHAGVVPRHEPEVEGVQEERVENDSPPPNEDEDEVVPVNEGVDLRQGRMVVVVGWGGARGCLR